MANFLVLGVAPDPTYALAGEILAAGHQVTVAATRELALRRVLTGLIDVCLVDSACSPVAEREIFALLARAVPELPTLLPRGVPLPAPGPSRRMRRAPPRRPITEPLLRGISYLFGIAEGRRLAIPAEVEFPGHAGPAIRGIATDVRRSDVLVDFVSPQAGFALQRLAAAGARLPAVGRLRFPGGGTLRIEGSVEPTPAGAERPTGLRLACVPAPAAAHPAASLLGAADLAEFADYAA